MKDGSLSIFDLLIRLWRQVTVRRRLQFLALFFLTVIASFAEMLSVSAVLPFIGLITDAQRMFAHPWARYLIQPLGLRTPQELLLVITVLFAAAAFWSGLMRLLLLWVQSRLGYAIGADFSLVMYNKTLYQPYSVHITRNSSEIIAGISNKAKSIVSTTILPLLGIFSAVLMVVTILGALLSIDPVISLMALVGFGLIYVLAIVIAKRRLVRCSQQISQGNNELVKVVQEGLGGIRDVLIDGTQDVYRKAYESVEVPLQQAMADVQIISLSPRYGVEALGMVLISALAYFLVGRSDAGASAIPVLGAFALGAQRMLPMLQQSYAGVASILGSKVLLQDSLELMEQPLPERVRDAVKMKFEREIRFDQLSFRYADSGPLILQGVDVAVAKGSRIGIVGNTGSGKSTLLDILMGLLPASAGDLSIDGVKVNDQNRRGWQKRIAHVPQAIFLSDASISENIALGVPKDEIDQERVIAAAKLAQAAAFIDSLEQCYETRVGERGVRLSGGQRQRIGIARALYKQADVLILDEATSALDNDTEREVMRAIDAMEGGLTVIIVAHRLSTLRNCNQIIELDAGKVKRIGTFDEIVGALA